MPADPAPTSRAKPLPSALDCAKLAEAIVFRWYSLCPEEHDQLSSEGLDALHDSIESVLREELP